MVILTEPPLAAETLIWNIACCTPWNSKRFPGPSVTQEPGGQHGRGTISKKALNEEMK